LPADRIETSLTKRLGVGSLANGIASEDRQKHTPKGASQQAVPGVARGMKLAANRRNRGAIWNQTHPLAGPDRWITTDGSRNSVQRGRDWVAQRQSR
jgi:hypothetical protein